MADFPPNLDDGELWLPSDIFPEVSPNMNPKFNSQLSFAQQISAYALLERNQNVVKPAPNFVPNLEIKRQSRYGTVTAPETGVGFGFGFGFGGGRNVGHNYYVLGNVDRFHVGFGQAYLYRPMSPAQSQVENYLRARARVSQRLQNLNQGQNQFLPVQVTGASIGGLGRESGGTGVFLPRVATTVDVKKKHGVRKGEENKQRQPTKNNNVEKQERLQVPPEVRLPQDWTY